MVGSRRGVEIAPGTDRRQLLRYSLPSELNWVVRENRKREDSRNRAGLQVSKRGVVIAGSVDMEERKTKIKTVRRSQASLSVTSRYSSRRKVGGGAVQNGRMEGRQHSQSIQREPRL